MEKEAQQGTAEVNDADVRLLLAEALDLAVRARKLDELTSDDVMLERRGGQSKSATPFVWAIDQYEKDLTSWEKRARKALS